MRAKGLALALALAAPLLALAAVAGGTAGVTPPADAPEGREEQAAALAAEIAAAKTHAIYLALDPRGGHLDLKVDGLLLRRFAVERGLFGRPRFSGGGEGLAAARFRLITELPEPERPLIPIRSPEGAGAGSSSLAVSEARAETVAQMPTHYRLRFQPPLEISVRGESGAAASDETALARFWRLRFRIYEGWQALGHRLIGQPVPPRIVLYFPPAEAQRLFMTLDPAMQLVISAVAAPEPPDAPAASATASGARAAQPVPGERRSPAHGASGRAPD
jgi:hypothetical protein